MIIFYRRCLSQNISSNDKVVDSSIVYNNDIPWRCRVQHAATTIGNTLIHIIKVYITNTYIKLYGQYIILHVVLKVSKRAFNNQHIQVKLVEQSELKLNIIV
jgi:hypothetical protein